MTSLSYEVLFKSLLDLKIKLEDIPAHIRMQNTGLYIAVQRTHRGSYVSEERKKSEKALRDQDAVELQQRLSFLNAIRECAAYCMSQFPEEPEDESPFPSPSSMKPKELIKELSKEEETMLSGLLSKNSDLPDLPW